MTMTEYVSVTEAAQTLGVNRRAVWRLINQGRLQAITNPIDHRAKLVKAEDVEKLARPGTGGGSPHTSRRPWPTTAGAADLDIRSDEVEEWLVANWRPA
jgi:excisionase family DNA binding protein